MPVIGTGLEKTAEQRDLSQIQADSYKGLVCWTKDIYISDLITEGVFSHIC